MTSHDVGQWWSADQVNGRRLHQCRLGVGQAVSQNVDLRLQPDRKQFVDAAHLLALRLVVQV
ncbi:MAG TPA: hypothetical protein VFC12_00525 [Terriglobales bacterium]|nr:hypothetical protein [Terriglobales bacterium]